MVFKHPVFYGSKSVAYDNGVIYCTNSNHVYALNVNTGKTIWQTALSDKQYVRSNVCIRNDILYIPFRDSLKACNPATGEILWSNFTGVGVISDASDAEPCATHSVVYIAGKDAVLYAFNAVDGKQLWSFPFNNRNSNVNTTPVILTNEGKTIYPTVSGMTQ